MSRGSASTASTSCGARGATASATSAVNSASVRGPGSSEGSAARASWRARMSARRPDGLSGLSWLSWLRSVPQARTARRDGRSSARSPPGRADPPPENGRVAVRGTGRSSGLLMSMSSTGAVVVGPASVWMPTRLLPLAQYVSVCAHDNVQRGGSWAELPPAEHVDVAVEGLRMLADPTRLRMLWLLCGDELDVSTLAASPGGDPPGRVAAPRQAPPRRPDHPAPCGTSRPLACP